MITNYCCSQECPIRESCNHFLLGKNETKSSLFQLEGSDLFDICHGERLFIGGDYFKGFPSKKYYELLLSFYDNICEGDSCSCKSVYYKNSGCSKHDCKLGKPFNCSHKKHPDNKSIDDALSFLMAENEAFKRTGISEGEVEFPCPICGGEAIGVRYTHNSPYGKSKGGIGSGCKSCGMSHT